MKKINLSESDIKAKFITPSILKSGWNEQTQLRREVYFTNGKINVNGQKTTREKGKFADYILFYKPNIPVAIIEAKSNKHGVKSGIQQALDYAEILDIPCVFSSNGNGFYFHDKTAKNGKVEKELSIDEFPSPDELWKKYKQYKNVDSPDVEKIISQDYFHDSSGKSPRYYQQIAINKTVEAIANKQKRVMLVMATGTGKTYTAFQIAYRLWKSKTKKRILFLADRTVLVDQAARGDFKYFKEAMTIVRNKKIDKAYNVYLALYQGLSDSKSNDAYKQFTPEFFDLVIVDECHRGSAKEDSKWKDILKYFNKATHIGLTATPKETKEVSNTEYFGDPIYTYSLKQGINDGFLAPYKVIKITLDIDINGWRPPIGYKDKNGILVEDRIYNRNDFDKKIIVEERRERIAERITEYLKSYDRFAKTIVFCTDIEHAASMRGELANANADLILENSKYVMQITGDNNEGKRELDNFINPSEDYPVIATTSKLMTTGVDAQTCKLIVLDSNIRSMTEFKQIIGRGTRINEEYGKSYFTIMDFRNVTSLFSDPDFDGDPVVVKEFGEDDELEGAEDENGSGDDADDGNDIIGGGEIEDGPETKIKVGGIDVTIINERVQYIGSDGKIITESLKAYCKKNVHKGYRTLDSFLDEWNHAEKKAAVVKELEKKGVLFDLLKNEVGTEYDPFDLVCHVAFDAKPLTRRERANSVKKNDYFNKYGVEARAVIDCLLDKYAEDGLLTIESPEVLKIKPLNELGSPVEIVEFFGSGDGYNRAIRKLIQSLYSGAIA